MSDHDQFDKEYADFLLSRLDSFIDSISEITQQLISLSVDEETQQRHLEYLTTQRYKVFQMKKSLQLRQRQDFIETNENYPSSRQSSKSSGQSRKSLTEKKRKAEI